MTLVAGVLRERVRVFIPLFALGKTSRYGVVGYGAVTFASRRDRAGTL